MTAWPERLKPGHRKLPAHEPPKDPCACRFPLLDEEADFATALDEEEFPLCWRCHKEVDLYAADGRDPALRL